MEPTIIAVLALVLATALILLYVMRGRHAPVDAASDRPVEEEIARYRVAVRADTLCGRCGQANPENAKYCHECGRTLPRVDAQEFDGTGAA